MIQKAGRDGRVREEKERLMGGDRYESQATFDRHFAAPEYAEFRATLKRENIIDFEDPVDSEIRVVRHVAGFL